MRRIWKVGLPAFAAVAVLLTATLVEFWITAAGRSDYYVDVAFNGIFISIAVLGALLIGLPAKTQHELRLTGFLSNLLVSVLACLMNAAVFRHKINWSAPLKELWGGHIGWLFGIALQILFLSGLGEFLLGRAKEFLMWLKRIACAFGQGFCTMLKFVRAHDKGIIAIMTASAIVWAVFLVSRVYHAGTGEVLADTSTFTGSLMVWITCVLTGSMAAQIVDTRSSAVCPPGAGSCLPQCPAICKRS